LIEANVLPLSQTANRSHVGLLQSPNWFSYLRASVRLINDNKKGRIVIAENTMSKSKTVSVMTAAGLDAKVTAKIYCRSFSPDTV